jgi:hypothetical protein
MKKKINWEEQTIGVIDDYLIAITKINKQYRYVIAGELGDTIICEKYAKTKIEAKESCINWLNKLGLL